MSTLVMHVLADMYESRSETLNTYSLETSPGRAAAPGQPCSDGGSNEKRMEASQLGLGFQPESESCFAFWGEVPEMIKGSTGHQFYLLVREIFIVHFRAPGEEHKEHFSGILWSSNYI